jgi:glycosyltransferase involved in cell wall biosynthesis
VAVLPQMDSWSASTRHRVDQHLPSLRRQLRRVEVLYPRDPITRAPGRAGQVGLFATHALRYAQRMAQAERAVRRHDALLIQRGLYVIGPGAVCQPVERFGGQVVFDLDDAVFEPHPALAARGQLARWLWGPQQSLRLLRRADAIVVSTPALAEMLPDARVEPVVLPTVPDPERYQPVRHREVSPVVIGWADSGSGLPYLEPLAPVLERLAREGVAVLEVVCSRPWSGPARFHRWRAEEATTVFGRFDVGIMPLDRGPYARAKAGFKLLQYMAAGLPVVASPVGINVELVERSGAGLLADAPEEWEEALRELSDSPELRRELGARGRSFVERYADLEAQGRVLAGLLAG